MRGIKVLFAMTALTLGCSSVSFAAEDAPKPAASAAVRTCSKIAPIAYNRAQCLVLKVRPRHVSAVRKEFKTWIARVSKSLSIATVSGGFARGRRFRFHYST
jgi:hypothetical protein